MVTASGTGLWLSGWAGNGWNVYFVMYTIFFDAAPRELQRGTAMTEKETAKSEDFLPRVSAG